MNIYKELFYILVEISCSIFLIIFGYAIWDNFETSTIKTANYYENNKENELLVENELDVNIQELSNENNVNSASIYLHNISKKDNDIALILKISKNIKECKDYLILKVDSKYYNLNDLIYKEDESFYYLKVSKNTFKSYETKDYRIKILANNDYNNCNDIKFTYSFFTDV